MLEMNKVFLIGNLTQDPELRSLTSGTPLAEFGLAVNHTYKDKSGERRDDTVFIQIVSWGRLAEFAGDWLKKGRKVLVEGRLKFDSWETKEGSRRSRIKVTADRIQFADSRPAETSGGTYTAHNENPHQAPQQQPAPQQSQTQQSPYTQQPAAQQPQNFRQENIQQQPTAPPASTSDDLPF
jgi:single-strand DNA-binding protein